MAFERISFPDQGWAQGAHPLERKKTWPARGATLLELAPGFEDPNLCRNGHFIYVLQGRFELDLEGGTERLGPGEACALDPGTTHRARNSGRETVLLLILSL